MYTCMYATVVIWLGVFEYIHNLVVNMVNYVPNQTLTPVIVHSSTYYNPHFPEAARFK